MACKYIYEGVTYNSKEDFINKIVNPQYLKGQSLTKPFDKSEDWQSIYQKEKKDLFEARQNGYITGEEYKTELAEIERKANLPIIDNGNTFLHLLSRDNNWITFFIKSIIQDSAKKGYEKVLFPTGDTASKVEGHTTLEEFKKQKEDRIKYLQDNNLELIEEGLINPESKYNKDYQGYIAGFDGITHGDKEAFIEILKTEKQKINTEITQLKQELERVEKEGFGALKPIYNFYENTVTNILNKNYKVTKITDEYGNTWNEINLHETTDTILFALQERGISKQEFESLTNEEKKHLIHQLFNC